MAGVVVLALGSGSVYAWQVGWLSRSYLAAVRGCGDTEWTAPEPAPAGEPLVAVEPVPGEVELPTDIAFHPTLDLGYVVERSGGVHVLRDGRIGPAVFEVPVSTEYDQGLLGAAVDPDGDWLYLNLTDPGGTSRLVAHPIAADGTVAADGRELLHVEQDSVHHKGGAAVFGPDGLLYLTFGDGGVIGDRWDNGQRWEVLLGGIVRIDPTPGDADAPYRIPPGNPHADAERGAENVAKGLRNPFRISFDAGTGDLWVADVGHDCYEELNRVGPDDIAGANFGWNRFEGVRTFVGGTPDRYVPPVLAYPHDDPWCAVIGGYVYRGTRLPDLVGRYVFSDFCSGALVALDPGDGVAGDGEDGVALTHLGVDAPAMLGFAEDPDGELYALSAGGGVLRLVPPGS